MKFRTIRFVVVGLMLLTTAMLTDMVVSGDLFPKNDPKISIKAYPPYIMRQADAQIRVTIRVPPDKRNTWVELGWDSPYPGEGGHSAWQLDEQSQTQWVRYIKHLSVPGTTHLYAALYYIEDDEVKIKLVETSVEVR